MAPCLESGEGGAPSVESIRTVIPPFLTKTYNLVEDASTDDIVSWGQDGTTFVVWRPPEFARDVLPKYFKHNNFSSFVRQLNTYGFRKIVSERWEFANEFFCKGNQGSLCEIHRRKSGQASLLTAGLVSPNSPAEEIRILSPVRTFFPSPNEDAKPQFGTDAKAHDETETLRRENHMLLSELTEVRRMHNELVLFIQNYLRQPSKGSRCLKTLKRDTNGSVTLILESSGESRESAKYPLVEGNIVSGKESICNIPRKQWIGQTTDGIKQSTAGKDMFCDTSLVDHASVGLLFVQPSSWFPLCVNEMAEPEVSTLSSLGGKIQKVTNSFNETRRDSQENHGDNPVRLFGFPLLGKKRSFCEVENSSSGDSNDRFIKDELYRQGPYLKNEKSNDSS